MKSIQAAPRVVRFAEVALVALLAEDIGAARTWVSRALGPLAADDDQTARLRETLHVFLSTGGGRLFLRSPPGAGTSMHAELPLTTNGDVTSR